ncbi:molybdopterin-dependent oxidoreductase [Amnibacterium flavum]|uniref:Oxidoreductase n=1 Tax=Amnibacterium flavum TaxID=2173173 RepID=A0A2V1HN84_9MICO|nr:molybdopterin-dependent oxidoreductase [Amnibacterium flavum]PVZ94008.1 oxidoreductase [Amnibacterium flavum]
MSVARSVAAGPAGVAAALVGVGTAELLAGIFAPTSSPLASVGAIVIDLAPPWAKETMIGLFGTADKPALITLLVIVIASLAFPIGMLERRRPPFGTLLIAAFGVLGVFATASRPDAGLLATVPAAAGTVVAALVLRRILRGPRRTVYISPERAAAEAAQNGRIERRAFLRTAGVLSIAGIAAVAVGQWAGASARRARELIGSITLPKPSTAVSAVPADASFDIPGISPLITSNDAFYRIDTALVVPEIDPAEWSLRITGMVEEEIEISWDELLALPLEESYATLSCVSNEVGGDLISTAKWLGYPVRLLLQRARPLPDADMVLSISSDSFTAGTPIEALTDDRNAIVAVAMNGEPLPPEHGFPARLVVPGLYGYVSATKWVVELKVTRFDEVDAYWTQRGWGAKGPVKLSSRIDVARTDPDASSVTLAGVAWSPHVGISAVEVQIDDGEWQLAQLAGELTVDTWRQWRIDLTGVTGTHTATVRATDAEGMVQIATRQGVLPDGATGYDFLSFTI